MSIWKKLGAVAKTVSPFVGGPAGLALGLGGAALGSLAGGRRRRRAAGPSDADRVKSFYDEGMRMTEGSVRARTSAMMPEFERTLQGIRESNRRRGISNGDLATSYEGDAASAFQRNIANAVAENSDRVYQTALDRLYGEKDRDIAARNARRAGRQGMFSSLASALGTGVGAYYGSRK